jgi:hypothetical protein
MALKTRSNGERALEDLLDEAIDSAKDGDVTVGSLLDAFGNRSFGPLIALFALIAILPPISGVPGVPTTMAVLTILVAVQAVFGAQHPWVPRLLRRRGVAVEKVEKARDTSRTWLERIDTLIGPRLSWAAGPTGQRIAAVCAVLAALAMPPLELLPFAAAAPASAILTLGLGLTARDGLLLLIGYVATIGTATLIALNLPTLFG